MRGEIHRAGKSEGGAGSLQQPSGVSRTCDRHAEKEAPDRQYEKADGYSFLSAKAVQRRAGDQAGGGVGVVVGSENRADADGGGAKCAGEMLDHHRRC